MFKAPLLCLRAEHPPPARARREAACRYPWRVHRDGQEHSCKSEHDAEHGGCTHVAHDWEGRKCAPGLRARTASGWASQAPPSHRGAAPEAEDVPIKEGSKPRRRRRGKLVSPPSRLARQATMESISPGSTSDAREGLRIKAEYGSKVPCPYKGASTLNADIEFDEGFDFQVRAPEEAFLTVEVWVQHPPTLRALLASRMFPVADLIAGRSDLGFVTFTADRANLSSEVPPSVYMSVAWQPETVPALEYGEPNPAPQGLENEGTLPRSDAQGLAQLVSAPQGIHSSSKRDAEGSVADVYGQLTPRRLSLDNFGA